MAETNTNTDEWMGMKQAYQQEVASYFRSFHQERRSHQLINPESVAEVDRQFCERIKGLREDYTLAIRLLGTL